MKKLWLSMAALLMLASGCGGCDGDSGGDGPADAASDIREDTGEMEDAGDVEFDTTTDAGRDTGGERDTSSDAGDTVGDTNGAGDTQPGDTEDTSDVPTGPLEFDFDFTRGDEGWEAGVADYSPNQSETIDFQSGIEPLPTEISPTGETGFLLSGKNVSDDLAMFLKRELAPSDGIEPGAAYEISYRLVFGSEAKSNILRSVGAASKKRHQKRRVIFI